MKSTIVTSPALPDNVLATGFNGLKFFSFIDNADRYPICSWVYNSSGNFYTQLIFLSFDNGVQCANSGLLIENISHIDSNCSIRNNQVYSNVALLTPVKDDLSYYIQSLNISGFPVIKESIKIIVSGSMMN